MGGSAAVTLNCTGLGHAVQRVTQRLIELHHVMPHKKIQGYVEFACQVTQSSANFGEPVHTKVVGIYMSHDVTSLTI